MLAIAILLLLTFVMSGRGVEDLPADGPSPKTPAEMVVAIRRTGWLRGTAVTVWFVAAFALHLVESQGRALVLLGAALMTLLCLINTGLANLAASREVELA